MLKNKKFANNKRMMELLEYLTRGGVVMYPIAFVSLVALTIFIERIMSLKQGRIIPSDLVVKAHDLVQSGDYSRAKEIISKSHSSVAQLLMQVIDKKDSPIPLIKESIEEQGRQESAHLEKFVGALGTIASIAPLLGVLGTVMGMIVAFQAVNESGYASPTDMAAGVWEALLTTAFGLSVGIAALIGHRYLLSKIDGLVLQLERESIRFFELVRLKQG